MTIKEAIIKSVNERNPKLAGLISDRLQSKGLNYLQTFEVVQSILPKVSHADWAHLLLLTDEGYTEPAKSFK